jgi:hypothetical protein
MFDGTISWRFRMSLRLASLSLIVALFPISSFSGQPTLDDAIAALQAEGGVLDVTNVDMSRNGDVESLVRMAAPCDESGCEWNFVARTAEGFDVVATGMARDAFLEATDGGGAVLNVDGATWAWSGDILYPYGSLLESLQAKRGEAEDFALVTSTSLYTGAEDMTLYRWDLDLFEDGEIFRVFSVGGLSYMIGGWGSPYLIYGENGALIDSGITSDIPRIFRGSDGASVIVIEVGPAAFNQKVLTR